MAMAQPRAPVVQTLDVQAPVPPSIVTTAGVRHLVYELHLTNLRAVDVVLTRVEVMDADRAVRLADYRDAELARVLGRPGVGTVPADQRVIGGGLRAVLYLWVPLESKLTPPTKIRHRIESDAVRSTGRENAVIEGIDLAVRQESPFVLDAPLKGGPWVGLYDPTMVGGHRTSIYTVEGRARIPARFAIDWVKLGDDGSRARGDEARVANWHGYGAEVLAVADGLVVDARDDLPGAEAVGASQGPMPLQNASGNFITLQVAPGAYVFYEHLQHGSLRVQAGQRVRRGETIARLGNTGSSSSGPHLHFHVADTNSTLGAEGLPWVMREFEVLGAYDSIDAAVKGQRWEESEPGTGGARANELPAPNVVVQF